MLDILNFERKIRDKTERFSLHSYSPVDREVMQYSVPREGGRGCW